MYRHLIQNIQVVPKGASSEPPSSLLPEEIFSAAPSTQIQEERLHPKDKRRMDHYRRLVENHHSLRTGELASLRRDQRLAAIRQQADNLARVLEIPNEEHTSNFT